MPNASMTVRHGEPFNMHMPAGCTRVPKTQSTNKPVAPGYPHIWMTDIPWLKERPALHTIFYLKKFFLRPLHILFLHDLYC